MNKTITVLGCGWLGLPIAIKLVEAGWKVKGSTTTPEKLDLLSAKGIDPYLVQLNKISAIKPGFFDSDTLLINIPPALRKQTGGAYLAQMSQLQQVVKASPVRQVLFISSTSVYPELNKEIEDTTEVDTDSPLYQSELLFTNQAGFSTTVIRFAGLIGPGRHPSRFFAGKQDIPNGKAPVNLIHLYDCIGLIEAVLTQQKFGYTYNAAAGTHPKRSEFYTAAAKQAGLPLPGFIDELKEWKIINANKIIADLAYTFVYNDLTGWVNKPDALQG
ncbi:SDR family oxidoreductase [Mucilaginibacter sp. HMF5004]|uniref:SDR family oxidoreductase n=1 Tax=Mucilaginibacter rivuli TaxID=2857527 RepID=UPI001C5EA507|nr:SDR family oxidoreductase [Mucilaginibacter rivuli]MBW4890351.1 SDR family oxidoreductase [Mucilaginibacter rivuli]